MLADVIDGLPDLSSAHKTLLRARWLDQVLYFEKAATLNFRLHATSRVVVIVAGALVPIAALLARGCTQPLPFGLGCDSLNFAVVFLGLAVALSASLAQFFQWDEQWRHYRRMAEVFKAEGWEFFQLSGRYTGMERQVAYPEFAGRIEELSRQYVEDYVTHVVPTKEEAQQRVPVPFDPPRSK